MRDRRKYHAVPDRCYAVSGWDDQRDGLPAGDDAVSDDYHAMSDQRLTNAVPGGDHAVSGSNDGLPERTGKRDGDTVPTGANTMPRQRWFTDGMPDGGSDAMCRHTHSVPGAPDDMPDDGDADFLPDRDNAMPHGADLLSAATRGDDVRTHESKSHGHAEHRWHFSACVGEIDGACLGVEQDAGAMRGGERELPAAGVGYAVAFRISHAVSDKLLSSQERGVRPAGRFFFLCDIRSEAVA